MYQVVTDDEVDALPDGLLSYYAQVLDLLELAPRSSEPYTGAKPDGVTRCVVFGPPGHTAQAIFLILDREQCVEIVRVLWMHWLRLVHLPNDWPNRQRYGVGGPFSRGRAPSSVAAWRAAVASTRWR